MDDSTLAAPIYHNLTYNDMPITDSHCHLAYIQQQCSASFEQICSVSQEEDMMILDIGVSPSDIEYRTQLTQHIPQVYHTVGMHPCQSASYTLQTLVDELETFIPQAIAIGEIGLDWYRMYSEKSHQIELFKAQIELANKYHKPIIIHSRESLDDIIQIVKESSSYIGSKGVGIIHCFSGDKAQAKQCIDLGFYISFAGNLSYASATSIQEAASYIPIEYLLTETDSPYLLHRDIQKIMKKDKKKYARVNSPAYLLPLIDTLASIRNISSKEIAHHARVNLHALLQFS